MAKRSLVPSEEKEYTRNDACSAVISLYPGSNIPDFNNNVQRVQQITTLTFGIVPYTFKPYSDNLSRNTEPYT